jgi:hypothetical protein
MIINPQEIIFSVMVHLNSLPLEPLINVGKSSVFHAARNIYFQNDTDIPPSQPPIFVAGSCMLCAALIAFWWFYTRKCCSRVQRFIRSTPEPEDEERFDEKFSRFGDGPYSKWYENCFTQTCHSVLLFRSLI